jgi:multidrug efflux pump subunit AcrA (membrane-fusion protein)
VRRVLAALGGVAALLAATAASCTGDSASGISTGNARIATVAEVVEAPASVTARTVATVTAPASGRVGQLFATDGQQVRAGDVLAVIDSPTTQRQLEQARKAVAAAESATVNTSPGISLVSNQKRTDTAAKDAFTTARRAAGGIPDPRLREATMAQISAAETQYQVVATQARNAAAAVSRGLGSLGEAVNALGAAQRVQAQTAYDLAAAQVDALTLKAPVSGTVQLGGTSTSGADGLSGLIGQLPPNLQDQASQLGTAPSGQEPSAQGDASISEGSLVGPGTAVATVVDVSALGLVAEVDETDVLLVKAGTTASVDLDAVPGAIYRATVSAVGLLPTASTRGGVGYRVRLTLAAGQFGDGRAAPAPLPGMSAVAKLEVRTAESAVAVPAAAIVRDGNRDTVWVVERGRAVRRPVTVGAQGEDLVEITEGLRAGQRIVVRGADQVKQRQELP